MFVCKMGKHHLEYGQNCQDFGMVKGNRKMVCDGCSQGAHSEVGAKAFVHLTKRGYGLEKAFERLTELFGQQAKDVKDYLCLTSLRVEEREDDFRLTCCGDGYVILEDLKGQITFLELSDGEYPQYYAYNYVDRRKMNRYRDGVPMKERIFPKEQYRRVGVATDGLRYVAGTAGLSEAFIQALQSGREVQVKRFVNKYQDFLKDDLTIAW